MTRDAAAADRGPVRIVAAGDRGTRAAVERLASAGWRVQPGWQLPSAPWNLMPERVVCHGAVVDHETAAAAVLAAVRGASVVLSIDAGEDVADALLDDLARVGPVDDRRVEADDGLDADQRELLARLAGGANMRAAASALHVSLRTAERRLGAARRVLGVRTTAEAIRAVRGERP